MRWWRFLAYNSAGAALWVSAWGVGVYVFGQHIGQLMPWVHRVGYVLLIAGAATLLLVLLGSYLHHRWAKCTTGEDHSYQERAARRAHRRVPPRASGA
jgi:membrane protein DedA with SNARE-associated domain